MDVDEDAEAVENGVPNGVYARGKVWDEVGGAGMVIRLLSACDDRVA